MRHGNDKLKVNVVGVTLMCVLVITVMAVAIITYRSPKGMTKAPDFSSVTNGQRLAWAYGFEPKPDITAYELAILLTAMMNATQYRPDVMKPWYDAMPENVKRHWRVPTEAQPPPTPPVAPAPRQN